MRIQATERSRHICPAGKRVPARSGGGFGFSQALSGTAGSLRAGTGPGGAAAICGPVGLLVAQEVDTTSLARRRAKRRAETLLDRLEDLRRDILFGAVPEAKLIELCRLVDSERPVVDDPQLASVLDEIDLRVRVELAKLDVARKQATEAEGAECPNTAKAEQR